eukprot:3608806-Pyramimonas_sp.AAC.1
MAPRDRPLQGALQMRPRGTRFPKRRYNCPNGPIRGPPDNEPNASPRASPVSYTHLRAHETGAYL